MPGKVGVNGHRMPGLLAEPKNRSRERSAGSGRREENLADQPGEQVSENSVVAMAPS